MPIDIAELEKRRRIPNLQSAPMQFSPAMSGMGMAPQNPMAALMSKPQSPLDGLMLQGDYTRPQQPSRLIEALMRLNNNQVSGY